MSYFELSDQINIMQHSIYIRGQRIFNELKKCA
jgi:hypothetical protein